MKVVYKHPLGIPARYAKPIGEIAAGWVLIELNIQAVIWHCLELGPKEGRTLTYGLPAIKKLELFKAMAIRWLPARFTTTELSALHRGADRLRGRRNVALHGLWGHPPGRPGTLSVFVIVSPDDKVLPRHERLGPADLTRIARDIRSLNVRLRKLLRRLGAPLP